MIIKADEASRLHGIKIEVIGKCNAICEFCSIGLVNRKFRSGESSQYNLLHTNIFTGEEIHRSNDKIPYELIDKILEVHRPSSVTFTGLCEPFLAADRMFYLADKLNEIGEPHKIAIYTNGSVIQEEDMIRILKNPNWISFHMSLNAVSDKTRIDIMGLPISTSENNLKRFFELRREMGREKDLQVGCVMMLTDKNRNEEIEYTRKWKEVFSKYKNCNGAGTFYTTNWNGSVPTPWLKSSGEKYCNQFDELTPTINSNGEIYLCCYSTIYTFGNVLDLKATKAWKDRKDVFKVRPNTSPPKELCGNCNGHSSVQGWINI